MPSIKRSISFNRRIFEEIEDYAKSQKIPISKAINDLCDRALHQDFDKNFAPYFARLVNDGLDRAVNQLEQTIETECERSSFMTIEGIRDVINEEGAEKYERN